MTQGVPDGAGSSTHVAEAAPGRAASPQNPGTPPIEPAGPDLSTVGAHMRECYDAQARRYREDDERQSGEPDHLRLCSKLRAVCREARAPLDILDLGCGTGRYFHCLSRVHSLTAFDVSPAMLQQARNPMLTRHELNHSTRFICGDFYVADLPADHFHLVYSFGVFGNGCAFTPALACKIFRALRPGGCLLFDAIDISFVPMLRRIRLRLRNRIHTLLPHRLKAMWDAQTGWLPPFIPTRSELLQVVSQAGFAGIQIESQPAHLPGGPGRKFECTAWKPPLPA